MSFECDKCGTCCKNIWLSNHDELDRGDGICKHLTPDNLCTIYAERPLICNVDAYYDKYLSQRMSRADFYKINYAACRRLKGIDSVRR